MVDGKEEFIDSSNIVQFLKTDPKARYQGYTFYFREGFCWSDINTTYLKCRIKSKSINDVKSMSLYGLTELVPEYYIVSLINSCFMSLYVDDFVNNTQTFQINDARQLPIIIPSAVDLEYIKAKFDNLISLKKSTVNDFTVDFEKQLNRVEKEVNNYIFQLYDI